VLAGAGADDERRRAQSRCAVRMSFGGIRKKGVCREVETCPSAPQ
jgi:hypothetical protein